MPQKQIDMSEKEEQLKI